MGWLAIVGIVVLSALCIVLFVVLPVLALVKARPEMRRMMRVRVEDPPVNSTRALFHFLERNDRRRAEEYRARRAEQRREGTP